MRLLLLLDKFADVFPFLSRKWVTISARTGCAAAERKPWAKLAEPLINALMGDPQHCHRAAVEEGLLKA